MEYPIIQGYNNGLKFTDAERSRLERIITGEERIYAVTVLEEWIHAPTMRRAVNMIVNGVALTSVGATVDDVAYFRRIQRGQSGTDGLMLHLRYKLNG